MLVDNKNYPNFFAKWLFSSGVRVRVFVSFELQHEPKCYLPLLAKVNKFNQNNHLLHLVHVVLLVQGKLPSIRWRKVGGCLKLFLTSSKLECFQNQFTRVVGQTRMELLVLNLFYSSNAFKTNLL